MSDQQPDEIAISPAASEFPEAARDAFLDKACPGDRELRERVARYLRSEQLAGPLDVGSSEGENEGKWLHIEAARSIPSTSSSEQKLR